MAEKSDYEKIKQLTDNDPHCIRVASPTESTQIIFLTKKQLDAIKPQLKP